MNFHSINNPDYKEIVIEKQTSKMSNKVPKIEISKLDKMLNEDDQPVLKLFGSENARTLQNARLGRKLKQKELAGKINESEKVINSYEQGKVVPNPKVLVKLRKELGIKFI